MLCVFYLNLKLILLISKYQYFIPEEQHGTPEG